MMASIRCLIRFRLKIFSVKKFKTISLSSKGKDLSEALIFASITLESGIDVGQGITVGHGKFVKKNKRRALNKHRA